MEDEATLDNTELLEGSARKYAREVVRLQRALETIEVQIARGWSVYEVAQFVTGALRSSMLRMAGQEENS
ncbi:MAG: hypothetical protein OWT27_09590 [Firmicutes bacterium]|nr:hypothetical protein [Bacillota bacterium]